MIKFIILTTQRSGSTLLWKYLDQHPQIDAHGEIFLGSLNRLDSYKNFKNKSLKNKLISYINKQNSIKNYINEIRDNNASAFGFKLMYNQINKHVLNWVNNNEIKIIHLIRTNTLKMLISRNAAKLRNLYHIDTDNQKGQNISEIYVDTINIIREIENIECEIHYMKQYFKNKEYIEISYENMCYNFYESIDFVYDFLTIDKKYRYDQPLSKINPDDMKFLIKNYNEVEKVLKNTKYEQYL